MENAYRLMPSVVNTIGVTIHFRT